jgi:colanic acid/amylovoran biosynthesis glycosyltransferase
LRHWKALLAVVRAGREDRHSCTFTYLALADSLIHSRADIVHAQFGHHGKRVAALKDAGLVPQPLVTSFRGGDTTIALKNNPHCYQALYNTGSAFTAVSRFIRNRQVEAGCPSDALEILHSGIDISVFEFCPKDINTSAPILLVVGRLTEVKGVRYVIEAMPAILAAVPGCSLKIFGDGELRSELEKLCRNLHIEKAVYFAGAVRSNVVYREMRVADIIIVPSIKASDGAEEGLPNSLKEAMAAGLPVVATYTGGIPELVEDSVTGTMVPDRDATAIASAVLKLLKQPGQTHSMVLAARRKVENEFDIEKLNDRLVGIYQEVINSGEKPR